VTLAFALSDLSLTVAQAATVALPRHPRIRTLTALRSRCWAVVPPLAIGGFALLVRTHPSSASALAYGALIGLPPLAAFALACAVPPGRTRSAILVAPLFALAWLVPNGLPGQAASLVLSMLAAVALAVLLTQLVPSGWLLLGMALMAALDATLVSTHVLQPADHVLRVATPPAGLPKLQSTTFGSAVCGFGDIFAAALFGAVLASRRRGQIAPALLTLGLALAFDTLFLVVHNLPATVPVAAAMVIVELRGRLRRVPAQPPSTLVPLSKLTREFGGAFEIVPLNSPCGARPEESTARALP
jgi:hypothetical protein